MAAGIIQKIPTQSAFSDWNFAVMPALLLSALERLGTMLGDKDTSLFPSLLQGVPTGSMLRRQT